eukprot:TRINITY_DN34835_c0_g1_i1.p3 TRINITY_DN34835_c0_g1~~TRINITY_DN34835_c0_g1_i1.p3  ORF type:complete len:136 (+),score=19.84 TRINITY_DN34835_c0_g1_i1:29-409(+)
MAFAFVFGAAGAGVGVTTGTLLAKHFFPEQIVPSDPKPLMSATGGALGAIFFQAAHARGTASAMGLVSRGFQCVAVPLLAVRVMGYLDPRAGTPSSDLEVLRVRFVEDYNSSSRRATEYINRFLKP